MGRIQKLRELGQSLWCDQLGRSLIRGGGLRRMIDDGITGVTSNPTIFEKSIGHTDDYTADIRALASSGRTAFEIYDELTIGDIRSAADIFRPVYDRTGGADGFISLEVRPDLAYDSDATFSEAIRLFRALDCPNVMIKVPATSEGIVAFERLVAEGVNVNVTLIFSLEVYAKVCGAYVSGLEKRRARGNPVGRIASVASFFVSRIDTAVDAILEERAVAVVGTARAGCLALRGRAAIANARLAYDHFTKVFKTDEFRSLGALPQRPLWASTSTKNPAYRDVLYVEELIGQDTVNTAPPATIEAFRDHGLCARTIDRDPDAAREYFSKLSEAGVDFAAVTRKLEDDGVRAFADSFSKLMSVVESQRQRHAVPVCAA